MNRKILGAVLATVAVFAMAVQASAQASKPAGLSARIGAFFPSSGEARKQSKTWLAAGLEYRLKDVNLGTQGAGSMNTYLTLSADYMGSGNFHNIPVLVNVVGRQNEMYWTAGVGAGFGRFQSSGATTTQNRTRFAYQVGVGYDFQKGQSPLFVEAKYFGTSQSELNGFGVYVGVRF